MLGQTVIIAVGDVAVGERKRPLNEEKVAGLAASIGAIGLLQPIVITERYGLVAGRHRLEALKRLGWLTAPAVIAPVEGLRAELAEIDENLIRNELTVLEQAEHLLRRSEILEALGERAVSGGQTGNKNATKNGGDTVTSPFPDFDPNINLPGEYVEKCIALMMKGEMTHHTFSGYDVILPSGEKLEVKHAHYILDQSRQGRKIGRWTFTRVDTSKKWDALICVCFPERGFDWNLAAIYKIPKEFVKTTKGHRFDIRPVSGQSNGHNWEDFLIAPGKSPIPKTTTNIATEMGISERSAQRRFQVARGLDAGVKAEIAAEPLANRTRDLLDLARLEPEEQRRVVAVDGVKAGETSVKRARRLLAVQSRREASPWPEGKYHVIYADPPWQYEAHGATVDAGYGGTGWHYPSMTVADLCALPVRDLAAADCALFIWVTSPKLNQVWAVLEAWGFAYKTSFVWDKVKHNFGYYNSVRHEFLLIAGRGSSTPENAKLFDSVQTIERSGEHSEKPEEFRRIIETLYPSARKIELFARRPSAGWDAWGNEALGIEAMGIEAMGIEAMGIEAMGSNGQHAD